jgi:putative transposase
MPRQSRLDVPGIPLHITHRGVNRCAVFVDDDDRHHFLCLLGLFSKQHGLDVHAYVLMGNHVHLLVTSRVHGAASAALKRSTQCYVQMFNGRHRRSGTLWEGRFKSCLVATDRYALSVYRYIERNPVRAGMTARPEDHAWSSVHANLGLRFDSLVTPHACYLALGDNPEVRRSTYREWLLAGEDPEQTGNIRSHLAQERAYGDARFQAMIEKTFNRTATVRPRGRPSKHLADD